MSRRRAELRTLLAGPIGAFLQYKRALGCKYKTEAAALHLLDGYLADPERVNDFETPRCVKLQCKHESLWWVRVPFSAG